MEKSHIWAMGENTYSINYVSGFIQFTIWLRRIMQTKISKYQYYSNCLSIIFTGTKGQVNKFQAVKSLYPNQNTPCIGFQALCNTTLLRNMKEIDYRKKEFLITNQVLLITNSNFKQRSYNQMVGCLSVVEMNRAVGSVTKVWRQTSWSLCYDTFIKSLVRYKKR